MKQPWARRVAWSPGHRLSGAYRWTWAALAVLTALVSAVACVGVLTALSTLLTLATFLCVFVSGGVLLAWTWGRSGWSAVAPTVVASVLLTAWVALLASSGAWATGPEPDPDRPSLGQLMHDRAWRDVEPEDAVPPTSAAAVARLSTRGLCRLWTRTSRELGTCRSVERRLELAGLRDECLGEMSRRDPAGFVRWADADPFATDPSGYLRSATSSSST